MQLITDDMENGASRETSLNRATCFMRVSLGAQLYWGIPGPTYTNVLCVQCWSLPDNRLVLVEVYRDDSICGGFDVFPVVRTAGLAETKLVIEGMAELEDEAIAAVETQRRAREAVR